MPLLGPRLFHGSVRKQKKRDFSFAGIENPLHPCVFARFEHVSDCISCDVRSVPTIVFVASLKRECIKPGSYEMSGSQRLVHYEVVDLCFVLCIVLHVQNIQYLAEC